MLKTIKNFAVSQLMAISSTLWPVKDVNILRDFQFIFFYKRTNNFHISSANNQNFAADVNVAGRFYNNVPHHGRNNQNLDGLTVGLNVGGVPTDIGNMKKKIVFVLCSFEIHFFIFSWNDTGQGSSNFNDHRNDNDQRRNYNSNTGIMLILAYFTIWLNTHCVTFQKRESEFHIIFMQLRPINSLFHASLYFTVSFKFCQVLYTNTNVCRESLVSFYSSKVLKKSWKFAISSYTQR